MARNDTKMGISLGTRMIGFALMGDDELLDWRLKTFKGKWSKEKLMKIMMVIERLIEDYAIKNLVVKIPAVYQSSKGLTQLILKLKILGKKQGMKLSLVTFKDILRKFSKKEIMNKKAMVRMAYTRFPEISIEWDKERRNLNPYYIKAIEAILAIMEV